MIEALRQRLQALQRPPGLEQDAGILSLDVAAIDEVLGGGLVLGALHEIAASGKTHVPTATGFALGLAALVAKERPQKHLIWIAEDRTVAENGAPYGPGLDSLGLHPEKLITVAVVDRRDLFWAMEEALRCRAVGTAICDLRAGDIDTVTVRRLSLAAAESGAAALLLRATPPRDASTAATRWIVGATPSVNGSASFAAQLVRNRRGRTGSWILQWSENDGRFTTHAQPVATPAAHRSYRKVARHDGNTVRHLRQAR